MVSGWRIGADSAVYVNHDAAAHLTAQDRAAGIENLGQADLARDRVQQLAVDFLRQMLPGKGTALDRAHYRIDSNQPYPSQNERRDAGREVHPPGEAAGCDDTSGAGLRACIGKREA